MAWTRRDGNKKGRMVSKYRRWKIPCIREEQHGINSRPCNNNNNPRSNSQPFLNFPFRTFHRFVLFFNRRDDDYSWIRFIPNRSKMIRPRLIMAADKWFRSAIRSRDIVRWAHVFWTWRRGNNERGVRVSIRQLLSVGIGYASSFTREYREFNP